MTLAQIENRQVLRLLSLLLALIIFLFVFSESKGEMQLEVPVNYINVPAGLSLGNPPVRQARVVLGGPRILLFKLSIASPQLYLDLQGAAAGINEFRDLEKFLRLDPEVRVITTVPAAIKITVLPTR